MSENESRRYIITFIAAKQYNYTILTTLFDFSMMTANRITTRMTGILFKFYKNISHQKFYLELFQSSIFIWYQSNVRLFVYLVLRNRAVQQ